MPKKKGRAYLGLHWATISNLRGITGECAGLKDFKDGA